MRQRRVLAIAAMFSLQSLTAAVISVTNTNGGNTPGSLANAIYISSSGDTIDCSAIAGQTIALTSSLPAIPHNLTISGSGIIIDGNQQSCQAFSVAAGAVTINDVTIQHAISLGGRGGEGQGGGGGVGGGPALYVESGANVILSEAILKNNKAQGGKGGAGNGSSRGGGGGGGFGGGNGGAENGLAGGGGGGSGGGIIKEGGGALVLPSGSSYTGTVTLNDGFLYVSSDSAFGASENPLHLEDGGLFCTGTFSIPETRGINVGINTYPLDVSLENEVTVLSVISGAGGLWKLNLGTLVLSSGNTYAGDTIVGSGVLGIAEDSSLGNPAATLTIAGVLRFDNAFSLANTRIVAVSHREAGIDTNGNNVSIVNNISGSGGIRKLGDGILTLSGVNTYTSKTEIIEGTLNVSSNAALGANSATLILSGGVLQYGSSFSIEGSRGAIITNSDDSGIHTNGHNVTISNVITGVGGIVKLGSGTLSFTNSNSYHGATTLVEGALSISSAFGLGSSNSPLIFSGGQLRCGASFTLSIEHPIILIGNSSSIDTNGNRLVIPGVMSGAGSIEKLGVGNLELRGINTYTGITNITAGGLYLVRSGSIAFSQSVVVDGVFDVSLVTNGASINTLSSTLSSGVINLGEKTLGVIQLEDQTYEGDIAGSGTFVKEGSADLSLTKELAFPGSIIVSSGTLSLIGDGSIASASSVEIEAGTLDVIGVYANPTIPTLLGSFSQGVIAIGSQNVIINQLEDKSFSGSIVGTTGSITKEGSGVLTLLNSSIYSGGTYLAVGGLVLGDNTALGTGSVYTSEDTSVQLKNGITISNPFVLDSGNTTFIVKQSSIGTLTGDITGVGSFVKEGKGMLRYSGVAIYDGLTTVSEGTLAVNGAILDAVIVAEHATVTGDGVIGFTVGAYNLNALQNQNLRVNGIAALTVNGNVSLNANQTLTVSGDVDFNFGSKYKARVDNDSSSLLFVDGDVEIDEDSSTLKVSVSSNFTNYLEDFTIVSADNIFGSFKNIKSGSSLVDISVHQTNSDISVTLFPASLGHIIQGNQNAKNVGEAIVDLVLEGNQEITSIFATLVDLPNTKKVTSALNQMQPALFKGFAISQENNVIKVQDSLNYRFQQELNGFHCYLPKEEEDKTLCAKEKKKAHLWIDGFGDILRQNPIYYGASPQFGYQTKTAGASVGVDARFADYFYLGALGAYTDSSVNWQGISSHGRVETGYGGLYFSAIGERFYGNLSAIGGWSHYKGYRGINYTSVHENAENTHGGAQLLAHADTGINLGFKGLTVRPFDSFDYITQTENSFTETGAGVYNLRVKKSNAILLRNELGVQLASCFCFGFSKWTISPKISWVREVRVKGGGYTSSFAGTNLDFSSTGYFPNRSLISPGVLVTGSVWQDLLTFSLYYNGEFGEKYNDHNYGGQIRFGF